MNSNDRNLNTTQCSALYQLSQDYARQRLTFQDYKLKRRSIINDILGENREPVKFGTLAQKVIVEAELAEAQTENAQHTGLSKPNKSLITAIVLSLSVLGVAVWYYPPDWLSIVDLIQNDKQEIETNVAIDPANLLRLEFDTYINNTDKQFNQLQAFRELWFRSDSKQIAALSDHIAQLSFDYEEESRLQPLLDLLLLQRFVQQEENKLLDYFIKLFFEKDQYENQLDLLWQKATLAEQQQLCSLVEEIKSFESIEQDELLPALSNYELVLNQCL